MNPVFSHPTAVKPALGAAERNRVETRLLTEPEVASLLGVSRRHFYDLRKIGAAPKGLKLGKSHRWDLHLLNRWIDQGCPVEPHIDAKGREVAHVR